MAGSGKKRQKKDSANKTTRSLSQPMSDAQRLCWACLHVIVFAVPLAISNWTWLPFVDMPFTFDQFDIVKVFVLRAATLVAIAAWSWHMLFEGGTVRRTKVDYLILVVLFWIALSAVFSIHPPTGVFGKYRRFEGFLAYVNYAVVYFLALQFLDRLSRARSLARTLFFSGVLVSVYGIMQYLGIDPLSWGRLPFEENRAFSTFGNPNLLGGFIIFPLVISLALALSEKDHRWRIAYWVGFLLAAVCWITAFTRGAWIGGAVGLLVLGVAAWRLRTRLTRVDWSFAGVIAAISAIVVARSLTVDDAVLNVWRRLASIFEFDRGSALSRFQIWDAAWSATLDRPVFGFGPDTFRLVFPGYKSIEYVQTVGHLSVADNVHNYFLQLTAAIGIPGMLLLYGLFIAVAVLSFRTAFVKPESESGEGRLMLSAFWAAAAGYLVHLTFGLSVTGSTFLLWIAMAAVMAPSARTVQVKAPSWGAPAAAAIVLVVIVASVGNVIYIAADHYYLQARLGGDYQRRLAAAERAVRLNPYNDMYRAEVGMAHNDAFRSLVQQIVSDRQAGLDTQDLVAQAQQVFELAEESLLDTIEFVPNEYDNYVFLTSLYDLAGQTLSPEYYERALEIGRKGIEVSEYGPAVRLHYSIALMGMGDYDEAEEQLLYALEMDPRYVEGNMLLGDVYMKKGDPAAALESYRHAKELRPDDQGIDWLISAAEASIAAQAE